MKKTTRKDLIDKYKIAIKTLIRIEQHFGILNPNSKKMFYSNEQFNQIEEYIKNNYILPVNAVNIKGTYDFITPEGKLYKRIGNSDMFIKAKNRCLAGYEYCSLNYIEKQKNRQKRFHRVMAETFLEKDDSEKNQVNHIDGNKLNNHISNLEWCSQSENMKHAFDTGLKSNDSGFQDSQSIPIDKFDLNGKILYRYGSLREAVRDTGLPMSTIYNQCKNKSYPRKYSFYFRYANN